MIKQANKLVKYGDIQQGIQLYKQFIQSNPGNQNVISAYYNLAIAYSRKRSFREASNCYLKIIEIDPGFKQSEVYYELGQIYQEGKMFRESQEAYQKHLNRIPNHPGCNFNLGNVYQELNEVQTAILYYEKAYFNQKDFLKAYEAKIAILKKSNRFKEVIKTCQSALKQDPMNFKFKHQEGLSYFKLEKYKEAQASLKQTIQINKKFVRVYITLAELYSKTGRKQGLEILQKCLEDNKDVIKSSELIRIRFQVGVLKMNQKKYQEATQYFKYVLSQKPMDVVAKKTLVKCLEEQGHSYFLKKNYSDAIECYKEAMKHDPNKITLMNNAGLAYQSINNPQEAQELFSKVLILDSGNMTALSNLATLEHIRGNQKKASKIFKQITKNNPESFDAHFKNGKRYLTIHRYSEALMQLKQAERLDKSNNFYLANDLAVALEVLGNYPEALYYAHKANELSDSRSPLFLVNRASILMHMKKINEATQDLDKASQEIKKTDKTSLAKFGINADNLKFIFTQLDHYSYLMQPIKTFTQTLQTQILKNAGLRQDERIIKKIQDKVQIAKTFVVQQVIEEVKKEDSLNCQISPTKIIKDQSTVEQYMKDPKDMLFQRLQMLERKVQSQQGQIHMLKFKTSQLQEKLVKFIPESHHLKQKLLSLYVDKEIPIWQYGKQLYWILHGYLKGYMLVQAGIVGKGQNIDRSIFSQALNKVGGILEFAQNIPVIGEFAEIISKVCGLFVNMEDQVIIKKIYEVISFNYSTEDELNNDICAVVMIFLNDSAKINKLKKELSFDSSSEGILANFKQKIEEVTSWFVQKKQNIVTQMRGFQKTQNLVQTQLAVIDVGLIISLLLTMQNSSINPAPILKLAAQKALSDNKMQEMICQSYDRQKQTSKISEKQTPTVQEDQKSCLVMRCQLIYSNPFLNDKCFMRYLSNNRHLYVKIINVDLNDLNMKTILKSLQEKQFQEIVDSL